MLLGTECLYGKKLISNFLILNKNLNLRWIIDLNAKPKTIKLLEENIRETLSDIGVDKDFLDSTQSMNRKRRKCMSTMVQTLLRIVWHFVIKLNTLLPYGLAISF